MMINDVSICIRRLAKREISWKATPTKKVWKICNTSSVQTSLVNRGILSFVYDFRTYKATL